MKNILLGATLLAAVGATPAHAVLQIAAQIGPDAFFCADNQACDTNPTTGVIQVDNTIIDGVQVDGSIQASDHNGAFESLNTSSLDLINTLTNPVVATIAVSDTGFAPTAATFNSAGSGTWQGPAGSAITLGWFVDPADAQGADNAFDTPGTLIDTFSDSAFGRTNAFSHNGTTIMHLNDPFSMTLQANISLAPGEALINRGQAIVTSQVPEPSTWAMLIIGFGGLMYAGVKRARKGERLVSLA